MPIRKFNNLEEINQYLNKETKKALEDTLKIMRAKLRSFVIQDVYDAYESPFYKRTRWLLKSGVIDYYITNMFNRIYGGIRINKKGYFTNAQKLQHSNPYEDGGFDADDFIAMLNDENNYDNLAIDNDPFHFPYLKRSSFWEDFIEWMKNETEGYAAIFKEKCEKRGIDLKNLGGSGNEEIPSKTKSDSSPPPATSITGTNMDIGRTAIPQRKTGKFDFKFGIGSKNNSSFLQKQLDALDRERRTYEEKNRYKG